MTTTIEMIERLEHEAKGLRAVMPHVSKNEWAENNEAVAQRLRELDKPDCGWQYVGGNTNYIMGCNKRANGVWSLYCPNCGGAVIKEST